MIKNLSASKFDFRELDDDVYFYYPSGSIVTVEARSKNGVTIHAVTATGVKMYLDGGAIASFHGRLDGFEAIEVSARGPVTLMQAHVPPGEAIDPTPMAEFEAMKIDPLREAALQLVREALFKNQVNNLFASDEAVAEFLDDLENGETDLEDEPDLFGLTAHGEAEEERFRQRAIRLAEEKEAQEAQRRLAEQKAAAVPTADAAAPESKTA